MAAANVSDMPITLGLRADTLELTDPGTAEGIPDEIYSHEPFGKHEIITFRATGGNLIKIKVTQIRLHANWG